MGGLSGLYERHYPVSSMREFQTVDNHSDACESHRVPASADAKAADQSAIASFPSIDCSVSRVVLKAVMNTVMELFDDTDKTGGSTEEAIASPVKDDVLLSATFVLPFTTVYPEPDVGMENKGEGESKQWAQTR